MLDIIILTCVALYTYLLVTSEGHFPSISHQGRSSKDAGACKQDVWSELGPPSSTVGKGVDTMLIHMKQSSVTGVDYFYNYHNRCDISLPLKMPVFPYLYRLLPQASSSQSTQLQIHSDGRAQSIG